MYVFNFEYLFILYRASIEACATLHILHGQLKNLKRMDNEILKCFEGKFQNEIVVYQSVITNEFVA